MPIEQMPSGGATITGADGMRAMRIAAVLSAMKMHVKTGGRVVMTRGAGPNNCAAIIARYYPDLIGDRTRWTAKALLPVAERAMARAEAGVARINAANPPTGQPADN